MDFLDFANQKSSQIKIVNRHIEKKSAALSKKFETRRISISTKRSKRFDPTEFSGIDPLLSRNVTRIIPAHKSELNLRPRLANKVDHSLGLSEIQSDWLFAKDCFTGPYRQFDQSGMCSCRSYNYNGIDRRMIDGLLNVSGGDFRSRKPLTIFSRLQIWISNDDYLNVGQTTQIAKVRLAHATNAEECHTDGRTSFHLKCSLARKSSSSSLSAASASCVR